RANSCPAASIRRASVTLFSADLLPCIGASFGRSIWSACATGFQFLPIDFDGDALSDQFDRENHPQTTLLAKDDAFHACQRPRHYPRPGSRGEIGMRLAISRLHRGAETFDFR